MVLFRRVVSVCQAGSRLERQRGDWPRHMMRRHVFNSRDVAVPGLPRK